MIFLKEQISIGRLKIPAFVGNAGDIILMNWSLPFGSKEEKLLKNQLSNDKRKFIVNGEICFVNIFYKYKRFFFHRHRNASEFLKEEIMIKHIDIINELGVDISKRLDFLGKSDYMIIVILSMIEDFENFFIDLSGLDHVGIEKLILVIQYLSKLNKLIILFCPNTYNDYKFEMFNLKKINVITEHP